MIIVLFFVELNIKVPREIKGDRFNVWNITSDGLSKFKELMENNKSLESMWQDTVSIESSYNGSSKLTVYYTNVLRKGE